MILITVTPLPETAFAGACDHLAEANVSGQRYRARSRIPESAVRSVVSQLAAYNDDQEVLIEWPTVVARHRSLWAFAGIKSKDEQQRACPVCHAPVSAPKTYCNNTCRVRASRAHTRKESA
jgi:hypothetical protein